MANQFINKVIYGGQTLIDITDTNINPGLVLASTTGGNNIFYMKDGSSTTGICTFDSDTKDATATAAEILSTKTAYVNKIKIIGSMPNIGTTTLVISTTNQVSIPQGYHDGGGKAVIDSTELSKLIPDNIRESVTILGVVGAMSGSEDVHATTSIFTPLTTTTTITPPDGFNYFTQFTVNAIPYSEADNAAGGKTATIAGS